ncbi:unnamed protein product [Schistosoma rodhaini]|uniref:Uncharacterized protein n=1 Tax=Schistosoma rodhaini TaxID=6188 RepID=A0AA85GIL5_9TREM|nr:unnamed protein product [Schistosoma rodhaini]
MSNSGIFVIFTVFLIYAYKADDCGNGEYCDVGNTFLHSTYCCKDSSGKQACCKDFRWWPLTVTICAVVLVLIIIFFCLCCCGCYGCLFDILCCCCGD